ncbi:MAG: aminotransferase class I/II-fold pyridoxal phosphate-dependent enzyme [Myxococcales bacterium]|nr:aminotransferase class I/II-fold pyridoxal phosphate-dependent enzyme [Myxococcales bacterium]
MSRPIDLRSDTVTLPTPGMLDAMVHAELGDDVLGDDPTVIALEARCAELVGKDAALFVPSGTMANLIAIEVSTRRGDEVLLHDEAHPFHYETAGAAGLAGVQLRRLPGPRGVMDPDDVRAAVRADAPHYPRTALLCVEDTHNGGGGKVQPLDNTDALCEAAQQLGLARHLDGARLLNASVASGIGAARRAQGFDTVSFCFSKGLGAPAGSVVCGDAARMQRARRMRKMLGGAMRQTGILAAAALYALDHHVERLADDHRRTAEIARGLQTAGFELQPPDTNIVVVEVGAASQFVADLATHGVRCFPVSATAARLVVHLGITDDDVPRVIDAFTAVRESAR